MITPTYKKIKKNGTTLYVFPGVTEDKNFETQNDNYSMGISHFAFVKFPRQNITENILDFDGTFDNNPVAQTAQFPDQLVESLRNYVANHETTIRNTMVSSTEMYYDVMENYTCTEKIFWKWAKKLGIIKFEPASISDYPSTDPKFAPNGPSYAIDYLPEILWKEKTSEILNVNNVISINSTTLEIEFGQSHELVPGDKIKLDFTILSDSSNLRPDYNPDLNNAQYFNPETPDYVYFNVLTVDAVANKIEIEVPTSVDETDFMISLASLEISNGYERFVKYMGEITGVNNVQMSNMAYTETYAYISHQEGETPYLLWRTIADNNYKPNTSWPILSNQMQSEIQGGENSNNPILTNPSQYPGNIWAQFDNGMNYITSTGNVTKRSGNYFGNHNLTNDPSTYSTKYPNVKADDIDGLTLDLDINDYSKARSYMHPINSFKEFSSVSFDEIAPKDFDFNAILWFYTIQDVTGNNVEYATNLYGIEFIDSPHNDIDIDKNFIPTAKKYVTNGYQDGNSYSFTLDTNTIVESYTDVPVFDPNKIYSLFGMELYQEALTRITYMNTQLNQLVNTNTALRNEITNLRGLIYTQENVDSIRQKINTLEQLLNVYSTLQIGDSDTIIPELDTTVSPALIRLKSIDKKYGDILHYYTKDMFNEFDNTSGFTQISAIDKYVPINTGKDFMVVVNNNDNNMPLSGYDQSIIQEKLNLVISKDLEFKQSLDILVLPSESDIAINGNTHTLNDKELNLYIKYNDGNTIDNALIKTLSLPVTRYDNGTSIEKEAGVDFERVNGWPVKHVYYGVNTDPNSRVFKFVVDGDLTRHPKLNEHMRIFLKNFILRGGTSSASNVVHNLSKQYPLISNANIKKLIITDTILENAGTGYTTGTFTINDPVQSLPIGYITINQVGSNGEIIDYDIAPFTHLSPGHLTTNPATNTATITPMNISGGTGGTIKFIHTAMSEIMIEMSYIVNDQDIISMFDEFDLHYFGGPAIQYSNACIDDMLLIKPELTLLKGTLINITRISDTQNVPVTEIDKRYNIKINLI